MKLSKNSGIHYRQKIITNDLKVAIVVMYIYKTVALHPNAASHHNKNSHHASAARPRKGKLTVTNATELSTRLKVLRRQQLNEQKKLRTVDTIELERGVGRQYHKLPECLAKRKVISLWDKRRQTGGVAVRPGRVRPKKRHPDQICSCIYSKFI